MELAVLSTATGQGFFIDKNNLLCYNETMLYPNLKIEPHAKDRILERMGFALDTQNSEKGIIDRINNESIHVCDDKGNKELRFFRISYKFYIAVISKTRQMVITIMYPNSGNYTLAVKRFERAVNGDTSVKTLNRYFAWRRDWLDKKGWSTEIPKDGGWKLLKLWGDTHCDARWEDGKWFDSENFEVDKTEVWAWKEIEVKKFHKIKPSKKVKLCLDCAIKHAGVDERHFDHSFESKCGFCEKETLCLEVHKDKTDLFSEQLEAVS